MIKQLRWHSSYHCFERTARQAQECVRGVKKCLPIRPFRLSPLSVRDILEDRANPEGPSALEARCRRTPLSHPWDQSNPGKSKNLSTQLERIVKEPKISKKTMYKRYGGKILNKDN